MRIRNWCVCLPLLAGLVYLAGSSQSAAQPPFGDKKGGPGGFGGPGGQIRKIVKDFDKNGDGRLDKEERKAARAFLEKERSGFGGFGKGGFGKGGFGKGGFGKGGNSEPPRPGPKVKPDDVKTYVKAGLYDPTTLRTLFLEFEDADWEDQLAVFYHTDVEIPATLFVDGKKYPNVGVRFRGMSSYFTVGKGHKRSLNISMDYADKNQRLYGHKTLNLLNGHDDPGFMNTVLYSQLANEHIPTPRANLVKVAINGESWGVYTSAQQFNKDFTREFFKAAKGTRWKVQGSPGGRGGLEYFGDNLDDYKRIFRIKSAEDEKAWKALVNLCKVLNETPADKLEKALEPILDVERALWFLALDVAFINMDGYWTRASDYTIYLDPKGKFHIVPHDMNEAFGPAGGGPGGGPGGFRFMAPPPGVILPPPTQDRLELTAEQKKQLEALQKEVDAKLAKLLTAEQRKQLDGMRAGGPGGPGGFGPPGGGGGGYTLDPLVGLNDPRKPLRSKLLAVPALRKRYLEMVRSIAEKQLDWKYLGPIVAKYRELIAKDVEADTRKLYSLEAFKRATADESSPRSLRAFADARRKYLLDHPEIKKLPVRKSETK